MTGSSHISFLPIKIFGGHKSFLCDHCYPCFGLLVMSALGFTARADLLLAFSSPLCNGFLRLTSGVTHADLLMAMMAAGHIPYMHMTESMKMCKIPSQS